MPNQIARILDQIHELLQNLDRKLDKLLECMGPSEASYQVKRSALRVYEGGRALSTPVRLFQSTKELGAERYRFVPGSFGSLPKHLRKSMETITIFGEASALKVSEVTRRSRAAESDYLNQLVDRGFLRKERRGREIVFKVFSLHTLCPMCGERVPLNVRYCSHCGAALVRKAVQRL